jgi:hypothetical protein
MASPFQFSVRQLLIAVAFVAIGAAALRNANSSWMCAWWGVLPLMLAVAILLAIFRRGQSQAFWVGFALFGWLYLAVVLVAYWPTANAARYDPLAYHQLATTKLIDWAYARIIPEKQRELQIPNPAAQVGGIAGMPAGMPAMGGSGGMPMGGLGSGFGGMGPMGGFVSPMIANPDYVDAITFQQIGHALWLVALAALGGKLGQWIHRTGVRDQGSGVSGP